jgi:CubicO group peptidase (beta-lactamase class C family)
VVSIAARARRLLLVALLAGVATVASEARGAACDFSAADAVIEGLLASHPAIAGAGLRVGRAEGEPLHERFFGSYGPQTVVPLASATKWLSAAILLRAVEDGLLGLDTPVAQALPGSTGSKAAMTPIRPAAFRSPAPSARLRGSSSISAPTPSS